MAQIVIASPASKQIHFRATLHYIEVIIVQPTKECLANVSSAIVKHEVEKIKEFVPQVKEVYIDKGDRENAEITTLMVKLRIKNEIYSFEKFHNILTTCYKIAEIIRSQLTLLYMLTNAQKDLKPFSKEYVENEQEAIEPTAEA